MLFPKLLVQELHAADQSGEGRRASSVSKLEQTWVSAFSSKTAATPIHPLQLLHQLKEL
jgi:hypothetical protein